MGAIPRVMRVCLVLRSGGDYRLEHVDRLRKQVERHLTSVEWLLLTDVGIGEPLRHLWPGWWSKMEMFRPDIQGDLLFMDLDSAVVGDLSDMANVGRLTLMRDVYRPKGLQSSVMYLPEADRAAVWAKWIAAPAKWMRRFAKGGDQAFLETLWLWAADRWQDVLPGQVVSFKVDVRDRGVPLDARFVAFHGRPRPWEAGW